MDAADHAAIGQGRHRPLYFTRSGPVDARRALYSEASQLNLEVPDLFSEGGDWFLLYFDQRDNSRQVRYLTATDALR